MNRSDELETIVQAIEGFPMGASMRDIFSFFNGKLTSRLIQRRLAQLVSSRQIIAEGNARARRYRIPTSINPYIVLQMRPPSFFKRCKKDSRENPTACR